VGDGGGVTPLRPAGQIKVAVARTCAAVGITALAERAASGSLVVLNYHRILPEAVRRVSTSQPMILSAEIFDRQMAEVARRYTVLSLDQVLEHYRARRPFPLRAVHVTFDDGYADNFEHALPILTRHSVPATFFLATGPIDERYLLWWDELGLALRALAGRGLGVLEPTLAECPPRLRPVLEKIAAPPAAASGAEAPGPPAAPVGLIDQCTRVLNGVEEGLRRRTVAALIALAAPHRPGPPPRLMMTWDEARAMHRAGMSLGAHTVHHTYLDELDDETGYREIGECAARIEREAGVRPRAFSYPAGRTTDRSRAWLERAGIELALTTRGGRNRSHEDRFSLKRWDGGFLVVEDRFVPAYMRLELSGAMDRTLRHRWYGPGA